MNSLESSHNTTAGARLQFLSIPSPSPQSSLSVLTAWPLTSSRAGDPSHQCGIYKAFHNLVS